MNEVLARWNDIDSEEAAEEILSCCGSKSWARGMASQRPILDETGLLAACDQVWRNLAESDWIEAFNSHPRIGESHAQVSRPVKSAEWSGEEQGIVATAAEDVKFALAEGNRAYEERFHRIFIVCAAGKSAAEILEILRRRMRSDETTELLEAGEQQRKIAHLRLKKWLRS
jgi:2-oxo-4-hydroxy-4-carboxy-5-ureidoimidazoline decarboxylase